jgi:signal transduction histidine kinase
MASYEFGQLADLARIREIFEAHHQISGMSYSLVDPKGNLLVSVGWQDICTRFHTVHPVSFRRCRETDDFINERLSGGPGQMIEYRCGNGLNDLVMPILIEGEHLATFLSGQFFYADAPPDREAFIAQAEALGYDKDAYLEALERVPRFSGAQIRSQVVFLHHIMQMLAETGLRNLQLGREMEERSRAQEAAAAREIEYRTLADNSPDNIVRYDCQCRMLYANRQAVTDLFPQDASPIGRTPLEQQARFPDSMPCEEARGYQEALARVIASGEPEEREVHLPGSPGPSLTHSIRFAPERDAQGRIVGALAFGRDITAHRRLEEQLRHSQKLEAVGQLAGGVAHDFNNILTAIIGFGGLAKLQLREGDPLNELIDRILTAADRAANLTKGMLAFSRRQVLLPRAVDLNGIVMDVEALLRRLIGEDIDLAIRLADTGLILMADPGQIEQVLMNLATNARDAMPHGGRLAISTEARVLGPDRIGAADDPVAGRYALITVSDTGVGMDAATRAKIFEPFFTTKAPGKGTGLGLSIAYGIIQQHEGTIHAYSEPGQGSTFRIYLPLLAAAPEPARRPAPEPELRGGTETILLAEDDPDVRTLATTVLRDAGYRVIEAVDGVDAVDQYRAHAREIDLLVLDVIMPRMSGSDAHDRILAQDPGARALFISGYTADALGTKGLSTTTTRFLSKPMSPLELLRKVRAVLDGTD